LASVDTEIADEGDYYSGKFSERWIAVACNENGYPR
jgi:hypothetical protein